MKMYKRLLLTYINKYHRIDTAILAQEMCMDENQIIDIVYSLYHEGYFSIENNMYMLTASGKEWILPTWNDWSQYKETFDKKQEFQWDYLYIPKNMI